jgi:hypothetical protein
MTLFNDDILNKASEVEIPELMDAIIEHQQQQDKNFNKVIKLLTEAVDKIVTLNREISQTKGEPLNEEIINLTDQVQKSLSLISSKQTFNDTNIMQGLVNIASGLKKISTSDISKGIDTLTEKIDERDKRTMKFTISERDLHGRVKVITAVTQ